MKSPKVLIACVKVGVVGILVFIMGENLGVVSGDKSASSLKHVNDGESVVCEEIISTEEERESVSVLLCVRSELV